MVGAWRPLQVAQDRNRHRDLGTLRGVQQREGDPAGNGQRDGGQSPSGASRGRRFVGVACEKREGARHRERDDRCRSESEERNVARRAEHHQCEQRKDQNVAPAARVARAGVGRKEQERERTVRERRLAHVGHFPLDDVRLDRARDQHQGVRRQAPPKRVTADGHDRTERDQRQASRAIAEAPLVERAPARHDQGQHRRDRRAGVHVRPKCRHRERQPHERAIDVEQQQIERKKRPGEDLRARAERFEQRDAGERDAHGNGRRRRTGTDAAVGTKDQGCRRTQRDPGTECFPGQTRPRKVRENSENPLLRNPCSARCTKRLRTERRWNAAGP